MLNVEKEIEDMQSELDELKSAISAIEYYSNEDSFYITGLKYLSNFFSDFELWNGYDFTSIVNEWGEANMDNWNDLEYIGYEECNDRGRNIYHIVSEDSNF
jgi:hypothetical protein